MKVFNLGLLIFLVSTAAFGQTPKADRPEAILNLPPHLLVKEKLIAIGNDFQVLDSNNVKQLSIIERIFHLGTHFEIQDSKGTIVGVAQAKFFTLLSTAEVYNERNEKIATIKEEFWNSIWGFVTQYTITDSAGKVIAVSEKQDIWTTNFTIHDARGKVLVQIHRSFFGSFITDHWEMQLVDTEKIDPRIALVIPALKTASDNARAASSDN